MSSAFKEKATDKRSSDLTNRFVACSGGGGGGEVKAMEYILTFRNMRSMIFLSEVIA
jgi:hypothetical protein